MATTTREEARPNLRIAMSERAQGDSESEVGSRSRTDAGASTENAQAEGSDGGHQDKGSGEKQADSQQGDENEESEPTLSEWVVGIASTLLVLALAGFVVWDAYRATRSPPIVTLRVERILAVSGGYVVDVGVYNEGGSTAKALAIQGTLKRDTVTVETSTATLSYVPAETEREAGLFFTRDPRQYKLELRPMGYDRP